MKNHLFYKRYIKRLLDIILSVGFIVLFWWLFLVLAIIVKVNLGSPILFKQPRPGKNGEIFELYKFRSMSDKKDDKGNLLPDEERLTKFGKMLRSTSLDELPEIFLILTGKMSICGPRPLLVEYLPYYNDREKCRHNVRPGLTGWAQVNGRNVTGWDEHLEQDVFYVENCSLGLDIKIILMTIQKVVKRSDILMGNQHSEGNGRLDEVRKNKKSSIA